MESLQDISAMLTTCSLQQIHQALTEKACDLLNLPISMIWLMEKDRAGCSGGLELLLLRPQNAPGKRPHQPEHPDRCIGDLDGCCNPLPVRDPLQQGPDALIVPPVTGDNPRPVRAFSVYTGAGDARDFSQADWDKKRCSAF